jgi:DNA polymerase V
LELHGIPAITAEHDEEKKQICTSRSFGEPVRDFVPLMEAIANFAASCCRKLRKQNSFARMVIIFISTNGYRSKETQYFQNQVVSFSFPTNETSEMISHCRSALEKIYKEGYTYKRAGVIVSDLIQETSVQRDLFDTKDRVKQSRLSQTLDEIAKKNGPDKIKVAAQGDGKAWASKREFTSRRFTTNLNEVIEVKN